MFKNLICAEPVHSRPPKFEGDTEEILSLVRYHIKWFPWLTFNVILANDQQFHNHRWHFFSMLLKGSYLEKWIDEKGNHHEKLRKAWRPSGFYFRSNKHFHEVSSAGSDKVYTLFLRVLWGSLPRENQIIYQGKKMSTTRYFIKLGWKKEELKYFWNMDIIKKQK